MLMKKQIYHNKSTVYLTLEQRRVIAKSGKTVQQFYSDLTDMYSSFSSLTRSFWNHLL